MDVEEMQRKPNGCSFERDLGGGMVPWQEWQKKPSIDHPGGELRAKKNRSLTERLWVDGYGVAWFSPAMMMLND
jgi:hypothetical protein